jgi:hypothetical protein
MAWEKRGNNRYYYRKQRIGNSVVSKYIGAGPVAELAVLADEERRQQREYERQQWQTEKVADQKLVKQVDDAIGLVRRVTTCVCVSGGYHQHKRQWRRYAAYTD